MSAHDYTLFDIIVSFVRKHLKDLEISSLVNSIMATILKLLLCFFQGHKLNHNHAIT